MRDPLVIEARPATRRGRISLWLRGRRLALAALLALAEVVAFVVYRPGALLAVAGATIVLVLAASAAVRVRPGVLRDLLWIVALAQAMVVVVPLLLGVSLVAAVLVAALVILGLVLLAARGRP